jgi:hypothetical protein
MKTLNGFILLQTAATDPEVMFLLILIAAVLIFVLRELNKIRNKMNGNK